MNLVKGLMAGLTLAFCAAVASAAEYRIVDCVKQKDGTHKVEAVVVVPGGGPGATANLILPASHAEWGPPMSQAENSNTTFDITIDAELTIETVSYHNEKKKKD